MRTRPSARVFAPGTRTLLFTSAASEVGEEWGIAGVDVTRVPLVVGHLDLRAVLTRLADLDCNEVLIEAGAMLSGAFVSADLVDEIVLYVAPSFLGPGSADRCSRYRRLPSLAARRDYVWQDVRSIGRDLRSDAAADGRVPRGKLMFTGVVQGVGSVAAFERPRWRPRAYVRKAR
jgi:diaminohydroxyphosphoribosylaminopyrimidine deaminase/5-amino-6-(5-phosphoribosylamino)uracil reductase